MKDQTKLYYFLVMVSIFLMVDQIQADKNAIEKATQFLLDHQNEDGSWSLIPGDELMQIQDDAGHAGPGASLGRIKACDWVR